MYSVYHSLITTHQSLISGMKKKIIYTTLATGVLLIAVVTADYFGLFGTSKMPRLDFAVARFKIVDQETGAPVFGSHVKCQQRGNSNACTLKDSKSTDVLSVLFPRQTMVTKTRMFTRDETLVIPENQEIYIFFVNPNYQTTHITLPIVDILEGNVKMTKIRMKARP